MAKKRKESSQSSTLHDFFGKSGGANRKVKQTRKRQKVAVKSESLVIGAADIIVIDSSDEDAGMRSASVIDISSSSDVEFVQGSSSPKKRSWPNSEARDLAIPPTQRLKALPSTGSGGDDSFGKPSLLLSESHELSNPLISVDDAFGKPYLLVSPAGRASFPLPKLPVESPPHPKSDTSDGVGTVGFSLDYDEWGTGDDERELVEDELGHELKEDYLDDAQTEVDIDLTLEDDQDLEGPPADEVCPICGTLLRGLRDLALQEHVVRCLEPKPAEDVGPKPLRPLSSIRAPTLPPDNLKGKAKARDANAFSVLMTSHKENEAWKEATVAEDRNFRPNKGNGGRRKAPFYKVMTGMPIAVDAFRYGTIPGVTAYFLTHAHSDHYTNLSSNWKSGPIYCSEGTANLIIHMLSVDPKWVHPLPMNVPTLIPDAGGVHVTLIEANHCPGSSLFLFEGHQTIDAGDSTYKSSFVGTSRTFRYLHCGDFRASPQHILHSSVKSKRIDTVYLDTTYLDPRYCFPSQPEVISACAELAKRLVTREVIGGSSVSGKVKTVDNWFAVQPKNAEEAPKGTGKTLVVVGTYSIGKERVVKAVAHALNTKVYCDSRKAAILRCQSDADLNALLTNDPYNAGVHLVPLGTVATDRLKVYIERWKGHFNRVVGFRPTGWTYTPTNGTDTLPTIASVIARSQSRTYTYANLTPMKNSTSTMTVYGVPYSEHSSFFELTCFALSFDWGRMIATVNVGSETSRGKMTKWVDRWEAERKKRGKTEIVSHRAPDYW